jgi:histidinol-phosphate aminotransferase
MTKDEMSKTMEELIPEYLRGLPVYVPGKPIEEVERELNIHAIKLASNENPLGPSPMAMEAARKVLADSNRYPDGGTLRLREKIAAMHEVSPDDIFIGLGSSELIDVAARVLLGPGTIGLTSEGTYPPFSTAIRANGGSLEHVPMCAFAYDLPEMARAITNTTRIIYLANPNNPTGTAFGAEEFERFLTHVPSDALVVLDEAYIHYAERTDMPRSVELFRPRKNLLILRTFSKVYGMAGIRIGYGIGAAALVSAMNKLRTPFNVSGVAQAAALAALDDHQHVKRCIEANRVERKRITEEVAKLGLKPVESETNFVFVETGPEAKAIGEELLREGVIVRPLAWMGFPEAIRISVGTAEENDELFSALSRVLAKRKRKPELTAR